MTETPQRMLLTTGEGRPRGIALLAQQNDQFDRIISMCICSEEIVCVTLIFSERKVQYVINAVPFVHMNNDSACLTEGVFLYCFLVSWA